MYSLSRTCGNRSKPGLQLSSDLALITECEARQAQNTWWKSAHIRPSCSLLPKLFFFHWNVLKFCFGFDWYWCNSHSGLGSRNGSKLLSGSKQFCISRLQYSLSHSQEDGPWSPIRNHAQSKVWSLFGWLLVNPGTHTHRLIPSLSFESLDSE